MSQLIGLIIGLFIGYCIAAAVSPEISMDFSATDWTSGSTYLAIGLGYLSYIVAMFVIVFSVGDWLMSKVFH